MSDFAEEWYETWERMSKEWRRGKSMLTWEIFRKTLPLAAGERLWTHNDGKIHNHDNDNVPRARCSHILVKHRESDHPYCWREHGKIITRTKDQALERIQMCREWFESGGDFGDLASQVSDCQSARFLRGALGLLNKGLMAIAYGQEFEDVAFTLRPGEISRPVFSHLGVHLLITRHLRV